MAVLTAIAGCASGVAVQEVPRDPTLESREPGGSAEPAASPAAASPSRDVPDLVDGEWIGSSYYQPEDDRRFRVTYDAALWDLSDVEEQPQLRHRALAACSIVQTAGRGLAPDWSVDNLVLDIDGRHFEAVEVRYRGTLQFVNYYTGGEEDYYTGFQVGSADVTLTCLEAAEQVLATFLVLPLD